MFTIGDRWQREEGFTLIELLMVLIILGILLMVAVPSYIGFKDRANKVAAQANVRSALPSIETYYADHNGYLNMTEVNLRTSYDAGLKVTVVSSSAADYCIKSTSGAYSLYKHGPTGQIVTTICT
jgi:prepilin-type N-terminal cleavage/methylation domain-containing protein